MFCLLCVGLQRDGIHAGRAFSLNPRPTNASMLDYTDSKIMRTQHLLFEMCPSGMLGGRDSSWRHFSEKKSCQTWAVRISPNIMWDAESSSSSEDPWEKRESRNAQDIQEGISEFQMNGCFISRDIFCCLWIQIFFLFMKALHNSIFLHLCHFARQAWWYNKNSRA